MATVAAPAPTLRPSSPTAIGLLPVHVDVASPADVVSWVEQTTDDRRLVLGANLHSLYLAEKDGPFRETYERADLVLPDGFPLAVLATLRRRWSGPVRRIGSTDWIRQLNCSPRPLRVALLGASEASNTMAVERLRAIHPQHSFRGWDGYRQRRELEVEQLRTLRAFDPDLVMVGLGMPSQEAWVTAHWDQLPATTIALVGGAIDQISGAQRLAPRWLGPIGLEWAWRLALEPRRLWRRYFVEPFELLALQRARRRRS